MTPALLSFLTDSLNESWNGFWDLITKADRLIDTDKANAETHAAVKAELEDLITLYRQNRVYVFSKGRLEIITVGEYCDRHHVATLDQLSFEDDRVLYDGGTPALNPAATLSAPLACALIDTYEDGDASLGDDWFAAIHESAYQGYDVSSIELLRTVLNRNDSPKSLMKTARIIARGKEKELKDLSKTWTSNQENALINPDNPKTLRELKRLSAILAYIYAVNTLRQADEEENRGDPEITVKCRRTTYRFGKHFQCRWHKIERE